MATDAPPRAGKFRPAFSPEVLTGVFQTMGLSDEEISLRLEQIKAAHSAPDKDEQDDKL